MRVGILGGGQLARMLALAGRPLGHQFVVLTATGSGDCPAAPVVDAVLGPWTDPERVAAFASQVDVVTLENENVAVELVDRISRERPVRPGLAALTASSDRLVEKSTFVELGIPTVPFRAVADRDELDAAVAELGFPAVLKTRRFGYDGRGQWVLRTPADVEQAAAALPGELILEGFAAFERELSIVAVRSAGGELRCYPLVENYHRGGILQLSTAPAVAGRRDGQRACAYVEALATRLDYVGVMALELFDMGGQLLANEMAPRVHNSGHWTIEGAQTSQFENHIRAVTGQPLGACEARGVTTMFNLIGELPPVDALLEVPGAHLHLYDKQARPGRKLGHLTVAAEDRQRLSTALDRLRLAPTPTPDLLGSIRA